MAGALDTDTQTGVDQLRVTIDAALAALNSADVVVIAVTSHRSQVLAPASADLASYGHPQYARDMRTHHDLAHRLAQAAGFACVDDAALHGDAAVLALQLGTDEARRGLPVVVIEFDDANTHTSDVEHLASTLDDTCALLAAGDLSSGRDISSPGYEIAGASAWDDAAIGALRAFDPGRWAELGPDEARRVGARGWAPLGLLLRVGLGRHASWRALAQTGVFGVGQAVGWAR